MGHDINKKDAQFDTVPRVETSASAGDKAGRKKENFDTVKQIRLSKDLFDRANAVFTRKGISFSEAVRLFLEQTASKKRLPFRAAGIPGYGAKGKTAEEEARFITDMLGIGDGGIEARLMKTIFGEYTSEDLSDDQLEEWAERTGLPHGMDPATLAELYDSGVFEKDPYSGSFDSVDTCTAGGNGCNNDCENCPRWPMAFMAKKENSRENLIKAFRRLYAASVKTAARMSDVPGIRNEEED